MRRRDNTDDTNDANDDRTTTAEPELSRFRHFGDEWQQICETLLSCEQLLTVMSNERHSNDDTFDDTKDDTNDCRTTPIDDNSRQQLRQIIKSIEPKKYSKSCSNRRQSARRSSYHRLKALTQLLMTTNLKRSTSLQSVPVVDDREDDTTATLPRLRRRPRIARNYHSFDVLDDNNDDKKGDRSGLSLQLSSSPQKDLNRHSCDVTSLLLSSPSSQPSSQKQILKYSKKRLRGPYGEMLESMMNTRNNDCDVRHNLSFIQELLRETQKQRKELDESARETTGTSTAEVPSITATLSLDTRTHIVGELYDTEKSFCEQLRDLQDKYSKPLIVAQIIDAIFVEIIFGKIASILSIHSRFLDELRSRIKNWNSVETTVGDVFDMFDDASCHDVYLSFVDNWFEAKQLIKQLSREKPLFHKFICDQSREHRSKLSLDELMISIIQRIPRLELLLKQLLKNTDSEHKDFPLLGSALNKVHSLALVINRVKNDTDVVSSSLSSTVDVSASLSVVQLESICDGLPVHVLTGTTLHDMSFVLIRKRERILLLFSNVLIILSIKGKKKSENFSENKYKVLNHFSLQNVDLNNANNELRDAESVADLERDLQILTTVQTSFVCRLSSNSRAFLETVFQDLNSNINKKMLEMRNNEKNLEIIVTNTTAVETTTQSSSSHSIVLQFLSEEKKRRFEEILKDLKSEKQISRLIPQFLCFLPIRKTRAGLQFTCASPTCGGNNVWICNSDGFVGQISVLSLTTQMTTQSTTGTTVEPTVVSCNGVCNSRIICMTCVPKAKQIQSLTSEESDVSDSDCGEMTTNETTSERQNDRSSLCWPTMWFGTEDSSVHIYSCFDAIRIKKNKVKVTLSARVESITFFEEKVFVSLANQSVAIFERDGTGSWNTTPSLRPLDCFRLCPVGSRLWTSGHEMVISVRDGNLEAVAEDIVVGESAEDFVGQMVVTEDNRVFVSTNSSLDVHCFTAEEPIRRLKTISIQTTLLRALVNCEEIIKQHKSACLRISTLLAVKDRLWIGTSAGVVCVLDSGLSDIQIVPNGHTGHVRFLTAVNMEDRTLVISGGDGIEIYRRAGGQVVSGESGREDSTNHLILWTNI